MEQVLRYMALFSKWYVVEWKEVKKQPLKCSTVCAEDTDTSNEIGQVVGKDEIVDILSRSK